MTVYDKLKSLGISLPPVTPPVAAFVPYTITGKLVFLSGTIARKDGKPWVGKLGREIAVPEGKEAARAIAIELMAGLQHAAGGNLDRVKQLVKLLVLVNSDPAFTEPHLVANGASELLKEVFGDRGAHARSAVGMAQLPFGSCVEIEMIAELE
jgi:enamine deaminase RidA (YjgF/YER057c/UK114 family)